MSKVKVFDCLVVTIFDELPYIFHPLFNKLDKINTLQLLDSRNTPFPSFRGHGVIRGSVE